MADTPSGFEYPLIQNNSGKIVPIRDFWDLDELARQAFKNIESNPQYSRMNRDIANRPIIATSDEMRQQYAQTQEQRMVMNTQTEISLDAVDAQLRYQGVETGIFYPIMKRLKGDLETASRIDTAKRYSIENGLIDANDPDIDSKIVESLGTNGALEDFNIAQFRKEYYGRELTDEETLKCVSNGLSPQAVREVANYVQSGYDFDASFEMMNKMTWAKWARDSRRFFSFANLYSMGVEMLTDPLTYLPYGVALKFPALMAKYVGRGIIANAVERANIRGLNAFKHFTEGAVIGGGAGFSYAQIRNYQGIDEDIANITGTGIALGGFLGILGGIGKKSNSMGASRAEKTAFDFAAGLEDAKSMDAIHVEVKKPLGGQSIGAMRAEEKAALSEQAVLKEAIRDEDTKFLVKEQLGTLTADDVNNHYAVIEKLNKELQVIDDRVAAEQAADRKMSAEVLELAENRAEAVKSGASVMRDERHATNEDFTKAQRFWKNFTRGIKNWTAAGVLDFQNNPVWNAWSAKLKPNETGYTMVDKNGKLINVRSADINLIDTQRVIQDRGKVKLGDFINKASELADSTGEHPQAIYDRAVRFMKTHHTMNPSIADREIKALWPLLSMFDDFRGMMLDQSKVIGVGDRVVINPKGESQLVPIDSLSQNIPDGSYFPSITDSQKLKNVKQTRLEKVEGWDSPDPTISKNAHIKATDSLAKDMGDNLYTGTRENETLLKVFDTAQDSNEAYKLSKDKNYKSDIQKNTDAYNKAVKGIEADEITLAKVNSEIKVLKDNGKKVPKNKQDHKLRLEKSIKTKNELITSLGVGNEKLGLTAQEQIYRQVRDKQLREMANARAYGMVNQNYGNKVGWDSSVGHGGIDYTEFKGNWWDEYYKSHESTASLSDILDTYIPRIAERYIDQNSAKLAANQVYGAKTWGDLKKIQSDWEDSAFSSRRITGKMSKVEQQAQQAYRGMMMGVFGIPIKGQNHLNGNYINASPAEGILEALKLATSLTKNGFFGFYNCNENSATIHAHGAMAFLKSLPVFRNRVFEKLKGISPSESDLRLAAGEMFADDFRYTRTWNEIAKERAGKYGEDSFIGKVVAGLDWAYRNSPLTRFQMHTQRTPEMMAGQYMLGDLARWVHSGQQVPKKGWGKGFFNQTDFNRMGIRADEMEVFAKAIKTASYMENGQPRINPDKFHNAMTPANRDVLHRMVSYTRDELIQGRSFMDNPLYATSELQPFWDMFLQFRSFSMQSFRKRILRNGNRIAFEGAGGEVAIQTMLNTALGVNMTLFKTIVRSQTIMDDEARESYLMTVLGVKSLSEIDLNDPAIYAKIIGNGALESSYFAGFSWAASLFSSQVAMRNTSTMDLGINKPSSDSPQIQKMNYMLGRNIPVIGKVNEFVLAANNIIKYGMQPSKFKDVNTALKDMSKVAKVGLPNDPATGALLRIFYEIMRDPN